MKKITKYVFIFILFFCLTVSTVFFDCKIIAKAENVENNEPEVLHTLIFTNISASDYTNIYGGETSNELSNFTPFDYTLGARRAGKSIVPTAQENNVIENFSLNMLTNGGLNIIDNKLAIGMWL